MNILLLAFREILHRKINFLLALLVVAVAAAGLVGALAMLRMHGIATDAILEKKRAEVAYAVAQLEDDYRKITKGMGFNILILPKGQNLGDFYAEDYAAADMPEEYADILGRSAIVTVRHLLPTLQHKFKWPEKERTILLVGARGEVPISHLEKEQPIMPPIPPGRMFLGYELHASLKIKPGDKVLFAGREYVVDRCMKEQGNKDDITVWIPLKDAQEILGKPGKINSILALECKCAWADVAKVREEIGKILPDTQVIEKATEALTRAEARSRAAKEAKDALAREERGRERLKREYESFVAWIGPLVAAVAAVIVGCLALLNVRARRSEIAILRAVGVRSGQVLVLLMIRAVITGLLGAAIGFAAGFFGAGAIWQARSGTEPVPLDAVFSPAALVATLVLAPVVTCVASWIPAMLAVKTDPAAILAEE
ncbi:MAG: FtsX-like permease family protein [Planctomycetota bacterium]|nr:FtsX-like permease family protein [Planctomycetota bacterium]